MRKERVLAVPSTRERLVAAARDLLDERAPDAINITELVERAGVTRPTFYATLGDLPSAFTAAAMSRLEETFASVGEVAPDADPTSTMTAAFRIITSSLGEHRDFYLRVLRGPSGRDLIDRVTDLIAHRIRTVSPVSGALAKGPLRLESSSRALASGAICLILDWLDGADEPATSETAADQARDLIIHSVFGGLANASADANGTDK